jgi:hypothetical protein
MVSFVLPSTAIENEQYTDREGRIPFERWCLNLDD